MPERDATAIVQFKVRMREPLRAQLELAAKSTGHSMNVEIVQRLEQVFASENRLGGPGMVDLMETIASVMKSTGEVAGFRLTHKIMNQGEWMGVPFAFEQAKRAAVAILEYHRPPGEIVAPTPNVVEVVGGDGDIAEANEQSRRINENLGLMFAEFELRKKEHDDE